MFELKIDTGNARHLQIIWILRELIAELHQYKTEDKLTDIDGNTVGEWKLEND